MNRVVMPPAGGRVVLNDVVSEGGRAKVETVRDLASQFHSLANRLEATLERGDAKNAKQPIEIAKIIRRILANRRSRERFFDPTLFADPAWDMLLDLAAAKLEGRSISISSLTMAASVPTTTALRWIKALVELGHLVRVSDPTDMRRTIVAIDDVYFSQMLEYLERVNYFIV